MSTDQLALFEPSRRLVDVDILDRLRGAEVLLADPATDEEERWTILALVVAPAVFGEGVEP